jgi:hypothetical protein
MNGIAASKISIEIPKQQIESAMKRPKYLIRIELTITATEPSASANT